MAKRSEIYELLSANSSWQSIVEKRPELHLEQANTLGEGVATELRAGGATG